MTFEKNVRSVLAAPCLLLCFVFLGLQPPQQSFTANAARGGNEVPSRNMKRGKYEPPRGIYLGAALDYSNLSGDAAMAEKMAGAMRSWEQESGRKHALYLQFIEFPHSDGSFPTWYQDPKGWASSAEFCKATDTVGGTPVLTLEPQQPKLFLDWRPGAPAYEATRAYAISASEWGKPLFIRFAHEMNGSWYPWAEWSDKNRNMQRDPGEETGFTPDDYKRAYRNVASMFRRYAPRAALIWCPNSGLLGGQRRDVFRPFYPGDDVVDWVGLDVYERGWTMPMPGAHLWAGQFAYNLSHDMADDPATPWNESVDFYKIFVGEKRKPLMLCETAATLSYRTDLTADARARLNHQWKTGYWNNNEYGWMQAVYGTSEYQRQFILQPIDKQFPMLKAVIWFQVAKREVIPVETRENGKIVYKWFENEWADYRIGGGTDSDGPCPFARDEIELYRRLTDNPYFLSKLVL